MLPCAPARQPEFYYQISLGLSFGNPFNGNLGEKSGTDGDFHGNPRFWGRFIRPDLIVSVDVVEGESR
jgi:hypothetical protein